MDFSELTAFVALADNLHFARAAENVHLSPSALSRIIRRLEEELGVTLLDRDTRKVALTSEGLSFLSFARQTIFNREDLQLRLSERKDEIRGILRVYASVTACYSILPAFVEALAREHPLLRLSVETGDPSDAASAVRDGRADLAVDALPEKGFRDLESYSVKKTPLVLVLAASGIYGTLGERTKTPQSFQGDSTDRLALTERLPLILPKVGIARERFDRWARAKGVKPEIAAETSGNEAVLALARLGLGLGLVPRIVLENSPFAEGLVIYDAGGDFGEYDIGFIQKPVNVGTGSARKVRAEIERIVHVTYRGIGDESR